MKLKPAFALEIYASGLYDIAILWRPKLQRFEFIFIKFIVFDSPPVLKDAMISDRSPGQMFPPENIIGDPSTGWVGEVPLKLPGGGSLDAAGMLPLPARIHLLSFKDRFVDLDVATSPPGEPSEVTYNMLKFRQINYLSKLPGNLAGTKYLVQRLDLISNPNKPLPIGDWGCGLAKIPYYLAVRDDDPPEHRWLLGARGLVLYKGPQYHTEDARGNPYLIEDVTEQYDVQNWTDPKSSTFPCPTFQFPESESPPYVPQLREDGFRPDVDSSLLVVRFGSVMKYTTPIKYENANVSYAHYSGALCKFVILAELP